MRIHGHRVRQAKMESQGLSFHYLNGYPTRGMLYSLSYGGITSYCMADGDTSAMQGFHGLWRARDLNPLAVALNTPTSEPVPPNKYQAEDSLRQLSILSKQQ